MKIAAKVMLLVLVLSAITVIAGSNDFFNKNRSLQKKGASSNNANQQLSDNFEKYVYAELIYNTSVRAEKKKIWVNSRHVSQKTQDSIAACKYTVDALDLMGEQGWELVNVVLRVYGGTYYDVNQIYYFKKNLN